MADKFTPGPWTVMGHEGQDGEFHALEVAQEHKTFMRVCFMTSDGPAMENAALISAAPEMLQMLRHYAGECISCNGKGVHPATYESPLGGPCDDCAELRQLIRKAEGR